MRMHFNDNSNTISSVPEKDLDHTTYFVSYPFWQRVRCEEQPLPDNIQVYLDFVLKYLNATECRLQEI